MSMETFTKDFSQSSASKSLDTPEFINGLKEKNEEAFRQLIDKWANKIYRLAYRFLKNEEDSKDIVQEVLQKIVEKINTFESNSSLYTWLYRITTNQCLMKLRALKDRHVVSCEEYAPHYEHGIRVEKMPDWSKVPEELFIKKEFQGFLQNCIDELPLDLKEAYILKDVEELSEEEVCKMLELTKPAMKNRVHRARLILRERLEKKYVR